MNKCLVTTVKFRDTQQVVKLQEMADAMGISKNATMNMLLDNAEFQAVEHIEVVATLPPPPTLTKDQLPTRAESPITRKRAIKRSTASAVIRAKMEREK